MAAGTAGNCGADQTLEYGTDLLNALNGWVNATASENYHTWKIVSGTK
jgi:hypothetical protein